LLRKERLTKAFKLFVFLRRPFTEEDDSRYVLADAMSTPAGKIL
jgi:hypothetical protein